MTEHKSQDKLFPFPLKQEPFEALGWGPVDNEMDDFKNSNSFFMNKFQTKNQFFNDFNPLTLPNPELNNDTLSIFNPTLNPNIMNDPADQSIRNNSSFPIFNERLLVNSNNNPEINVNTMNKHYSLEVMNNMRQVQTFPNPMANYFPFANGIRRPLPQELLDEEPVYVNPKQYERIMKMRIKKAKKGIIKSSVVPLERPKDKNYKHLSRHLHAKRREREAEIERLEKEEKKKAEGENGTQNNTDKTTTMESTAVSTNHEE